MTVLRRSWRLLLLGLYVLWSLVRSNVEMARVIAAPGTAAKAVLALPLETDNEWAITTLANIITLTPGTLALDVDDDRSALYVHVITIQTLDDMRGQMRSLQRRVVEAIG